MTHHPRTAQSNEAITPVTAELLSFATVDSVSDAIKAAGCSVTAIPQDDSVRLHSASHGIGFQVLWGSAVAPGQYADLTLTCPLRVQGGRLPEVVLSSWHQTKRFARVSQHGDFVVLEMDVVVVGGVSKDHLAVLVRLWTQVMGEFFLHLRNYRAPGADANADRADPATPNPEAARPAPNVP